jgi:alkanesulfonate monooxygenase SsuD/methylene tetrahydromethanopterin reductase-like flavin-dependent oxidoreductase (luciferase family)
LANEGLKAAYRKTQQAILSDVRLHAFFSDVFRSRLFDWDEFAHGFLNGRRAKWEKKMRKLFAEKNASHQGRFYQFEGVTLEPRPVQQPHPPIALSLLTPSSNSAATAGERGWIPVSGQFFHRRYLKGHWEKYVEGCERAGRRPDPDQWRVSRSVLVTESDAEAEEYLADPDNGLSFYYRFFHHSFSKGRKALFMLKPDLLIPDEDVTMDMVKRALVIAGSPKRVLEQLVALREETGHFGTLLMGGHDWDRPALWRRSMELLATEVMPKFSQHATVPRT